MAAAPHTTQLVTLNPCREHGSIIIIIISSSSSSSSSSSGDGRSSSSGVGKKTEILLVIALGWGFCADLRKDSDFCWTQHQLIGFCNLGGEYLLRGKGLISYIKKITFGLYNVKFPLFTRPFVETPLVT